MSVEPGSTASTGERAQQGQASPTMHDHVNSIKSKLGLDNANSPLGKLAAHTRRKLTELQTARKAGVTAAPGSPDWQAAMKPESFSKGFIKANRTQFLITASIFSLGLFWLLVIRFVHHNDNTNQTGNSELAQKALATKQMQMSSGMMTAKPIESGSSALPMANFGSPSSSFGSPGGGFGAPASVQGTQAAPTQGVSSAAAPMALGYPLVYSPYAPQSSQQSAGYTAQTPGYSQQSQGYAQQPQGYPQPQPAQAYGNQGAYTIQPSSYAQRPGYAQQAPGYGIQMPVGTPSSPHPTAIYPLHQHTTARHQVVVTR
jgi:hypothetical protein